MAKPDMDMQYAKTGRSSDTIDDSDSGELETLINNNENGRKIGILVREANYDTEQVIGDTIRDKGTHELLNEPKMKNNDNETLDNEDHDTEQCILNSTGDTSANEFELEKLVRKTDKEKKVEQEIDRDDSATEHEIDSDIKTENEASNVDYKLSKRQAWINLIIVSTAFMTMFAGVNTFVSVQSTLNKEEGLGTVGLTVLYVSAFATNFFLPVVLSKFGSKIIMTVSIGTYIAYIATGYYPAWSTVIPGAVVIGIGAPHLWVASQSYITDLVKFYKTSVGGAKPEMITMFFGVFFAMHSSSRVWGNLYSSFVFGGRGNYNQSIQEHDVIMCGARYCPGINTNNTNLYPPSTEKINLYTSLCIGCVAVAILCTLFLRNLPLIPRRHESVCGRITNVFKHMFTSRTQRLLMAVSVLRSVSRVFIDGDFTVAFVSCTIGVEYVGFAMIAYGIVATLFSVIAGKMCKYTGELVLFVIAFAVQIAVSVAMLLWEPTRQHSVIYVFAALWGIADAIYATTITGLYSMFFTKDRDTAFTAYRFLDSFGSPWPMLTVVSSVHT